MRIKVLGLTFLFLVNVAFGEKSLNDKTKFLTILVEGIPERECLKINSVYGIGVNREIMVPYLGAVSVKNKGYAELSLELERRFKEDGIFTKVEVFAMPHHGDCSGPRYLVDLKETSSDKNCYFRIYPGKTTLSDLFDGIRGATNIVVIRDGERMEMDFSNREVQKYLLKVHDIIEYTQIEETEQNVPPKSDRAGG